MSYKDLDAWKKSMGLAKAIYSIKFPDKERFGLESQIRRCAVSIPSNIAEGDGRFSLKESVHFIRIAKGSLYELETQLILAKELGYIDDPLEDDIGHLRAMLINLTKSLETRASRRET